MTERLFVYGTLAPGGAAWSVLEPWTVGDPGADSVAGLLYDTGRGYPAATFGPAPESGPSDSPYDSVVHGTVVDLDRGRMADALRALDRYEGREYERVVVRTTGGGEVYTYAWIGPLAGCSAVPGGRWRTGPEPETRAGRGR